MSRHVPRRERWSSDGPERYRSVDGLLVRRYKGQWWADVAYRLLPDEPAPEALLPQELTPAAFCRRNEELCRPRLARLADCEEAWWLEVVPFFDVQRQRIWIFWRRVLHTAHHRTQLSVYLRLLGKPVPPSYGPTADVTWTGADPTRSVEAAGR